MRNEDLDFSRGLLIFYVVVFVHGCFWLELIHPFVASLFLFEMPLLFFIAGCAGFLAPGNDRYLKGLLKKIVRLWIPYYFYVVFCILAATFLRAYLYIDFNLDWKFYANWLMPNSYGKDYPIIFMNWHLWFVPVFMLVSVISPLVREWGFYIKMPLMFWYFVFAAIIYIVERLQFSLNGWDLMLVTYLIWYCIGYRYAENRFQANNSQLVVVVVFGVFSLLFFGYRSGDIWSLFMQKNKFPPNVLFFIFSSVWVAFWLLVISFIKSRTWEMRGVMRWRIFKPFIAYGYSIFLWQGIGYSLASVFGSFFQISPWFQWGVAISLSLILGKIFSPLEKIKISYFKSA